MNTTASECQAAFRAGAMTKVDYIQQMHGCARHLFGYASLLDGSSLDKIEISANTVQVVLHGGGRFAIDPLDVRQPQLEELYFRGFEAHEWRTVIGLIQPGMTVFDIGANIGWYTVRLAIHCPETVIHSFEPVPHTYETLQHNVSLNPIRNVTLHPFGLSSHGGVADFYFSKTSTGAGSAANILELSDFSTVRVTLRTLDAFCRDTGVAPDFIKCDVEGGELAAMQGGIETIRRARPIIFMEMLRKWAAKFGYHPNSIIALMQDVGYKCFELTPADPIARNEITDAVSGTNFLFLHTQRHADILTGFAKND